MRKKHSSPVLYFRFSIVICFIFCASSLVASKEDSLRQLLKTKKDTARIQILVKIARFHATDTVEPYTMFLNEAYRLAKTSKNKLHLAECYNMNAICRSFQQNDDSVNILFDKAFSIYESQKDIQGQIKVLYNKGRNLGMRSQFKEAATVFLRALTLAKAANDLRNQADLNYYLGKVYSALFDLRKANEYNDIALLQFRELKDSVYMGHTLNNIGSTYHAMAEYSKAIEAYVNAKTIFHRRGMLGDYAGALVNSGFVYENLHNLDKALSNFYEAEKILEQINHVEYLANVRHSIGSALHMKKDYKGALQKFEEAKKMFIEQDNTDYYANTIISIAEVNLALQKYKDAEKYALEGLKIKRELEEFDGLCLALSVLGDINLEAKHYDNASKYYSEILELATNSDMIDRKILAYERLADLNIQTGNSRLAGEYYSKLIATKDSLYGAQNAAKIAEMETLFKTEKQASEIEKLNQQKIAQENQLKVSSMQRNILFGGVLVLIIIAFLIFTQFKQKQKSGKQLELAYEEIKRSRDEISFQKKEITDSILYAKKIQEAILPADDELKKVFSEHFILYQPKDIVSGDLYWYARVNNKFVIAAVDCTGHGVPGAFMSVIANDLLNQLVIDKQITDPSVLLSKLDKGVLSILAKGNSEKNMNDGMDMALCTIDLDTRELTYSGAHRPLICFRDSMMTELRATKASIGGYFTDSKQFNNETVALKKGDSIYMFTDGYADQFGGEKGKKFKYKKLLSALKENIGYPLDEQKTKLINCFHSWRGNHEQVDDVLLIGIRL